MNRSVGFEPCLIQQSVFCRVKRIPNATSCSLLAARTNRRPLYSVDFSAIIDPAVSEPSPFMDIGVIVNVEFDDSLKYGIVQTVEISELIRHILSIAEVSPVDSLDQGMQNIRETLPRLLNLDTPATPVLQVRNPSHDNIWANTQQSSNSDHSLDC